MTIRQFAVLVQLEVVNEPPTYQNRSGGTKVQLIQLYSIGTLPWSRVKVDHGNIGGSCYD